MHIQSKETFFEVPQWQKILHLMSGLKLGGVVPISRIPSPFVVFLVSFHIIKLGWMNLFFVLLPTIGFLFGMFSASME